VKFTSLVLTCALLFLLCVTFERQAYAYVDPGSSLVAFQSLTAIVTGLLFYLRKRIRSFFTRSKDSEANVDAQSR
jgi:hypothetical protein